MRSRYFILASEDALSEAIATKLLQQLGWEVSLHLGRKGKGYLRKRAQELNKTARGMPVLMLTDQDSPHDCPPQLIQSWIQGDQHPNFLLRVAVMEVESWILADRRGFANFLSIPLHRIPEQTDTISQPKEFLISLARLSRKTLLRNELVPLPGGTSVVGPAYNSRLGEFVRMHWELERAATVSYSLARTLNRLRRFTLA